MSAGHADLFLRHLRQVVAEHADRGLSDRELLRRFATLQDQTAFTILVRRHGPMVLRVAQRVLHQQQDSEDVFQASFLILARKAASGRWHESVAHWLHGVAYHLALKARAAALQRQAHESRASRRAPANPQAEMTLREAQALLDEELNRLPEKFRAPLVIWHLQGRTQDETARQLGWTKATTRRRLEQGRNLLRTRLARRGFNLGAAMTTLVMAQNIAPAVVATPLVTLTVRAALGLAQGKTLACAASVQVACLAKEGAVLGTNLKATVVLLLGVTVMAAGAGALFSRMLALEEPKAQQAEAPRRPAKDIAQAPEPTRGKKPRLDLHGDPLPDGALLRLGTVRFRHPDGANCLILSPDGRYLATRNSVTVRVWDAATGKQLYAFPFSEGVGGYFAGQEPMVFSPDSHELFAAADAGQVLVWDLDSGKRREVYLGDYGRVHSVCLTLDNQLLAAGTERGVMVRNQTTGRVLYETGNPRHPHPGNDDRLLLHGPYSLAVFAPDGGSLAVHTSAAPKVVRLCDPKTGEDRRRIELGARLVRLAFSPDGRHIAVTERDNAVRVYETETGRRVYSWVVKLDNPSENYTSAVAFAPDGKFLAAGATDNLIRMWDLTTGQERRIFRGHSWYVTSLAFGPGGKFLYSTSWDGTVRRWEVASGKELPVADGYSGGVAVAFAPDGTRLASASDAPIHIWDASTGRRLRVLKGDPAGTTYLAFSPNGRTLAAGGVGLTVHLWDAATGNLLRKWHWPKGKNPSAYVDNLMFSPDSRVLATAVFRANQVLLWDVASGQRQLSLNHEMVRGVAFPPRGKTLISVGWDKALRLWELPSGKLRETFVLPGEPDPRQESYRDPRIECLAISPDGRFLATNQLDGSVFLWYLASGRVIHQFKAHHNSGRVLAFSPDGLWLACLGEDNSISVVDSRSGQVVLRLRGHQGRVCDLAFSPDGRTLLSGSRDNTALLWSLRPAQLPGSRDVQTLWDDLGRPDAASAYRALWRMADMSDEAVRFLGQRLKPIQAAPEDTTRPLVADLDNDSFERREQATKRLQDLGQAAEPALRAALESHPSAEQKRRLEILLAALDETAGSLSEEMVRQLRAVAVLQRIVTPQSREVLDQLADGCPSAVLTQQAKAALQR
jgi:RNA polymerase sigma factor (sigma-70 family)